ncbi:MAG: HPr kinase/phosphatase C-terminal domain-containing protein [Alphaproteobacteria bacterium GM7ARS4]|nr:HPr kinase/phosphatase C-terminal domain-containing protein [Alphaproteobacteria bacterium GM7ARS4]
MHDNHQILHATALSYHQQGILLQGDSGQGKSETALCLIDRGAILVADDMVILYKEEGRLFVAVPDIMDEQPHNPLWGKLALRGIGMLDMPYQKKSPLHLFVTLHDKAPMETPCPVQTKTWWGLHVPVVACCAFEHTAAIKILYALRAYAPNNTP